MSGTAQKTSTRQQQGTAGQRRTDTRQQGPDNQAVPELPLALARIQQNAGNQVASGLLGGGRPLPPEIRIDMETRFAADFGAVRVHDDARARHRADLLGANAFTYGNHLVFGNQGMDANSSNGRRLLAHELAHVIQQRRGGPTPPLHPSAAHERDAEAAARAIESGGNGQVCVAGATGVGLAADWKDWVKDRIKEEVDEYVPDSVKEVASDIDEGIDYYQDQAESWVDEQIDEHVPQNVQDAASTAMDLADTVSDTAGGFLNPTSLLDDTLTELRDAALNDLVESSTGADLDAPGLREVAHEKSQEAIGMAKGVATQGTDLVDTAIWASTELRDLQEGLIRTTARALGVDEDEAVAASKGPKVFGIGGGWESMAELGDLLKEHGLVDADGNASLTAPVAQGYNALAKQAEEAIGAEPGNDDSLFTPMEIGEIKGIIGTQVALAFVGVTEVKVALNLAGAVSGLRNIVESARSDPNWPTSPRFWGGIIGTALSLVGFKAAVSSTLPGKMTTLLLKYGWVAAAVPPMAAMIETYFDDSLSEEEREKRMKQHYTQVLSVLKDAILHVGQAVQAGKPPPRRGGAPQASSPAAESASPPPARPTKSLPTKIPQAKTAPGTSKTRTNPSKVAKPGATVTPARPSSTNAKPAPAQPLESGATPMIRRPGLRQSQKSKALAQKLKNLPLEKQGTVTPLRKPTKSGPPAEPATQAKPLEQAEPLKVAVGQSHSAADPARPRLQALESNPPPLASANGSDGKSATSQKGPATGKGPGSGGSRRTRTASGGATRPRRRSAAKAKGPSKANPAKANQAKTRQTQAANSKPVPSKPDKGAGSKGPTKPLTPDEALADFQKFLTEEMGAKGKIEAGEPLKLYRHGSRATVVKYLKQYFVKQAKATGEMTWGDVSVKVKPGIPLEQQAKDFMQSLEGAHSTPQTFGKKLPKESMQDLPGGKYNPDDALVVLTEKRTHTKMDQPWKDTFNGLRKGGKRQATAQEVFDSVADGIRKTPGMSEGEKASRIARLKDEMFVELGLDRQQKYPVPRIIRWWEILRFKNKKK